MVLVCARSFRKTGAHFSGSCAIRPFQNPEITQSDRCPPTRHSAPESLAIACSLILLAVPLCGPALAQGASKAPASPVPGTPKPAAEAAPQAVPGFWDPRRRPERPDLSRISVIRFLTETDYPPFNFTRGRRQSGRLQCRSRALAVRRDQGHLHHPDAPLRDAARCHREQPRRRHHRLHGRDGAAAHPRRFHTDPYYRAPARFVSRRDGVLPEVRPEYLEGKKVGAVRPAPRMRHI